MGTRNEEVYRLTPGGLIIAVLERHGVQNAEFLAEEILRELEWCCMKVRLLEDGQWTKLDLPAIVKDGDWDFQKVRRAKK
ncbi:MAG: hypothetical protein ACTSSA_11985 [Candidatus Freyarchaeota archaeon]